MSLMLGMFFVQGWNVAALLHNVADVEVDNTLANDVFFDERRYSKKVAVVDLYVKRDCFRCWLECMN